ncbi:hypothetical protein LZK76_02930 [Rhizobium leguminosarum]|nr:hypothetical protein LZK76_02930 [Rhizobium leguminosarum]
MAMPPPELRTHDDVAGQFGNRCDHLRNTMTSVFAGGELLSSQAVLHEAQEQNKSDRVDDGNRRRSERWGVWGLSGF